MRENRRLAITAGFAIFVATLRWLRTVGDVVFLVGVGALAWFFPGHKTAWSFETQKKFHGRTKKIANVALDAK